MRALNLVGLLSVSLLAAACGGDSANNPTGDPDNVGGQAGSGDPGETDAGSNAGGEQGDAGDGAGGTATGGKSSAGAPSRGGAGGGVTPPGKAGAGGVGGVPLPPGGGVGVGGTPSIDPPEGCTIDGFTPPQMGYCAVGLTCEDRKYIKVSCFDQGAGDSYCDCSGETGSSSFVLPGVVGAEACESAGEICKAGPPDPGTPEECMPRLESRSATFCQLEQICTQEVGDDGPTVGRLKSVSCSDDGTGRLLCGCSNQPYQYHIEGESGLTACDTLLDYCDDPVSPTFEQPGDCRPQSQNGGMGYCEILSSCLLSDELAENIQIVQNTYAHTYCSSAASGDATCTCSEVTSFSLAGPVTGIDSCSQASSICSKIAGIEPDGEITCENISQNAQGTFCNATLDCSASATIDDISIDLHGTIGVSCSGDAGNWSCACSSGTNSAMVSATGDTAWDACTNGAAACEGAVEVQFGSGGAVGMPVPPGAGGRF